MRPKLGYQFVKQTTSKKSRASRKKNVDQTEKHFDSDESFDPHEKNDPRGDKFTETWTQEIKQTHGI